MAEEGQVKLMEIVPVKAEGEEEGGGPRKKKKVGVFGHSFIAQSRGQYTGKLNALCPGAEFHAHADSGSGPRQVVKRMEEIPKGAWEYEEVIIHTGVNNLAAFHGGEKKMDEQLEWVMMGLEKAVRLAKKRGARKVILVEATPWKGYRVKDRKTGKYRERWNEKKGEYTVKYNKRLEELAQEEGVELVRLYEMMEEEGEEGALRKEYTRDGLHPNGEGLDAIVGEIARTQYAEQVDTEAGEGAGEKERAQEEPGGAKDMAGGPGEVAQKKRKKAKV